jgi:hypothetical protein
MKTVRPVPREMQLTSHCYPRRCLLERTAHIRIQDCDLRIGYDHILCRIEPFVSFVERLQKGVVRLVTSNQGICKVRRTAHCADCDTWPLRGFPVTCRSYVQCRDTPPHISWIIPALHIHQSPEQIDLHRFRLRVRDRGEIHPDMCTWTIVGREGRKEPLQN